MPGLIRAEHLRIRTDIADADAVSGKVVLPGEVRGVTIRHWIARGGKPLVLTEEPGAVRVRVFLSGSATLLVGSRTHVIDEIAVVVAARSSAAIVQPTSGSLEFLEIVHDLAPGDEEELERHPGTLPYFLRYSECGTYREDIKSAKTVSRTLVPPGIVPRIAFGSVQTTGPDLVGAHQHPMLEQFFFGLTTNDCHVRADNEEIEFSQSMLLHIPLGSLHSVRVGPGHALHYLWMDFFGRTEDTRYISRAHIPLRP
jgi:hypothetical protein